MAALPPLIPYRPIAPFQALDGASPAARAAGITPDSRPTRTPSTQTPAGKIKTSPKTRPCPRKSIPRAPPRTASAGPKVEAEGPRPDGQRGQNDLLNSSDPFCLPGDV